MDSYSAKLSEHECHLAYKYYSFFQGLEFGRIEPTTPEQKHFIEVCNGNAIPETEHEIVYKKIKEINKDKMGGEGIGFYLDIQSKVVSCIEEFDFILTTSFINKLVSDANNIPSERYEQECFSPIIFECLTKYINSEMDFNTSGKRGLGRMTDEVPRFGGEFKDDLINLPKKNIDELSLLIYETAISGYCAWVALVEVHKGVLEREIHDIDILYGKWVPLMYSPNLEEELATLLLKYIIELNLMQR